ncbi:MAG: sigma-70 family RNA polymerase sigma factor [Actinomycetota bacterium]
MTDTIAHHPVTLPEDLAQCDDSQLLSLVRRLPLGSAQRSAACEVLVTRYQPLVRSCVRKYWNGADSADELMQVGYVGLMKAINKFDPEVGGSLAAYAFPSISGELKRHFRDRCWQVHVKRSAQELVLEMRTAIRDLTHQLGRAPDDAELARHLRVSVEQVLDARRADLGFNAWSLDAPLSDGDESSSLGEFLGEEDPQVEHTLDMAAVSSHWNDLPERQQRILLMRFYGNMTQAEIGTRLGISQMHVSRLMSQSLNYLRGCLLDPEDQLSTVGGS